jgi:hypothetical protein
MVPVGSVGNTASDMCVCHNVYFTQKMLTPVITVPKDCGQHCYTNTLALQMRSPSTIWIKNKKQNKERSKLQFSGLYGM